MWTKPHKLQDHLLKYLIAGTAVIINRGDMGDYGTVFKTIPETTKEFANRITCFKVPGVKEAPVTAQGILPDLSMYTVSSLSASLRMIQCCILTVAMCVLQYIADYVLDGKTGMVYQSHYTVGSKINNYTLIVDKNSSVSI